jgi:hypothetical protein
MLHKFLILASMATATVSVAHAQNLGEFLKGVSKAIESQAAASPPAAPTPAPTPAGVVGAPTASVAPASESPTQSMGRKLSPNPRQYPPELLGAYVLVNNKDAKACDNPAVVIEAKQRYNEVDASCQITKIAIVNGKYSADEKCGREDTSWAQKTIFDVQAPQLSISENSKYQGSNAMTLRKCGR